MPSRAPCATGARAQPHRYALLYGSPAPGYAAPQDTVTPATRVTGLLLGIVRDAEQAGVRPTGAVAVPPAESAAVRPVATMLGPAVSDEMTVRALTAWATLFGHVSLELFGHMHQGGARLRRPFPPKSSSRCPTTSGSTAPRRLPARTTGCVRATGSPCSYPAR